jgi:hypothetical protein
VYLTHDPASATPAHPPVAVDPAPEADAGDRRQPDLRQ